jgi:RNA polymerase sigma-70 factor (ECF subfamily)
VEKEFLEMMRRYSSMIYKVARIYRNKDYSLEDIYQEIILNLWKSYPSFRGDSISSTWIYRVALNTCISFFRKSNRRPTLMELSSEMNLEYKDSSTEVRELYDLINQLGKVDRALIFLYLEDRPQKEIAEIMGISVSNVSTRINRIKEKLKKMSNQ